MEPRTLRFVAESTTSTESSLPNNDFGENYEEDKWTVKFFAKLILQLNSKSKNFDKQIIFWLSNSTK